MGHCASDWDAWAQWTLGERLFTELHAQVRGKQVELIAHALERAEAYQINLDEDQSAKGQKACALLWCALKAAQAPPSLLPVRRGRELEAFRTTLELDKCCDTWRGKRGWTWAGPGWLWGCVLSLLDAPVRRGAVYIPVVGCDDRNEGSGFLNTLVLEVLETATNPKRAGELWHHPRDALVIKPDQDFVDSMDEAWHAARSLVAAELAKNQADVADRSGTTRPGTDGSEHALLCDARWRILSGWAVDASERMKLKSATEAAGRSASAAAALGWWLALTRRVPDHRVIAIGQIDREGTITGVQNQAIESKVKATIYAGTFDTIAVVKDRGNLDRAQETINREMKDAPGRIAENPLRVVDIAEYAAAAAKGAADEDEQRRSGAQSG
jgi:hypothetical protein